MSEIIVIPKSELEELINASIKSALAEREAYFEECADDSDYYTIKDLMKKWNVSATTIWRHAKLGHIKAVRIGRRVLFPKSQIDNIKNLKSAFRSVKA